MDKAELIHMHKTITLSTLTLEKDAVWIKAFNVYNQINRPLSMGCRYCYSKVIQFHLKNKSW